MYFKNQFKSKYLTLQSYLTNINFGMIMKEKRNLTFEKDMDEAIIAN